MQRLDAQDTGREDLRRGRVLRSATAMPPRAAVAALALVCWAAPVGALEASCAIASTHAGDVSTASCYGWCSPVNRVEHCSWCQCQGCAWCAGPSAGGSSGLVRQSGSGGGGTCRSGREGDSNFADCASFCSAAYKADHCGRCQCQACGFCKCSSGIEGDTSDEQCQDWCALEYSTDHCKHCRCKGCSFCSSSSSSSGHGGGGGAITSGLSATAAAAAPKQCAAVDTDDRDVFDCLTWCSSEYGPGPHPAHRSHRASSGVSAPLPHRGTACMPQVQAIALRAVRLRLVRLLQVHLHDAGRHAARGVLLLVRRRLPQDALHLVRVLRLQLLPRGRAVRLLPSGRRPRRDVRGLLLSILRQGALPDVRARATHTPARRTVLQCTAQTAASASSPSSCACSRPSRCATQVQMQVV